MRVEIILNFECQKCFREFDCEVGGIVIPGNLGRPQFEKSIFCPSCGKLDMDDVLLTELGKTQYAAIAFIGDDDEIPDSWQSGPCRGCDDVDSLNDIGFCVDCAEKLDRDHIRQRQWAYSQLAFGLDASQCELLRKDVIAKYGEKLEIIAPAARVGGRAKSKRRRKGTANQAL